MNKKKTVIVLLMILIFSVLPVKVEAANKAKLNKTEVTTYVGSSVFLKINGTSKKVKWSMSNRNIAVIEKNGKVTAKKSGKATLTATIGKKSYKCNIIVKNPHLNSTKKTLTVGKTYQLKITGTDASKWISSKKSIAKVDKNGKVTAKKVGKSTITCKGKDGKTYKCIITVKARSHVHEYTQAIVAPTCTGTGYTEHICNTCNY